MDLGLVPPSLVDERKSGELSVGPGCPVGCPDVSKARSLAIMETRVKSQLIYVRPAPYKTRDAFHEMRGKFLLAEVPESPPCASPINIVRCRMSTCLRATSTAC